MKGPEELVLGSLCFATVTGYILVKLVTLLVRTYRRNPPGDGVPRP